MRYWASIIISHTVKHHYTHFKLSNDGILSRIRTRPSRTIQHQSIT